MISKLNKKVQINKGPSLLEIQEIRDFDHNEDIQICTGRSMEGRCDNILQLTHLNLGYIEGELFSKRTYVWQKFKNEIKILIEKGPSLLENSGGEVRRYT